MAPLLMSHSGISVHILSLLNHCKSIIKYKSLPKVLMCMLSQIVYDQEIRQEYRTFHSLVFDSMTDIWSIMFKLSHMTILTRQEKKNYHEVQQHVHTCVKV